MSSGKTLSRPSRRDLLLVALLALLAFLPGLTARDLWNPDEPRYAEVAREMLLTGEYFVPHLNGEIYTQKPPLQFWAMALSSFVTGGMNEAAARLPAVLAATGTLLLIFWMGSTLFGRRAAWFAVAAFGTGVKILWQGRIGQIDMLLVFLVTLAVAAWVRGELELGVDRSGRRYYLGFFLATGLATIAKGPAGFLPPLFAILAYHALTRDFRGGLRRLRPGLGMLIWVVPVLAWLVPAGLIAGGEYLEQIVFKQNVTRYANPWHHHQPWYYYLTVIPADFFPWAFLLPTALVAGWKGLVGKAPWKEGAPPAPGARGVPPLALQPARYGFFFALLWMTVTVLFFSLSPAKRTVYILTMYPGMSLLVGAGLDTVARWFERERRRRWRFGLLIPLGLLAVLLTLGAAAVIPVAGRQEEAALFTEHLPLLLTAWVAVGAAGALAAFVFAWRREVSRAVTALAAGMALMVTGLVATVLPHFDLVKSPRAVTDAYLRLAATDGQDFEPYALYPRLDAPVLFYTKRFAVWPQDEAELRDFVSLGSREQGKAVWIIIERDELRKLDPPLTANAPGLEEVARDGDPIDGYVLLRAR